ncbi:MAG: hemolysin family protein [Vicinamibacterales bacterium]|nr:hemolysin family protein [Vicinamibacterales bacterium]
MAELLVIVVILVLVLLNGMFVAAEFAVVGASRHAVQQAARSGRRGARALSRVVSDATTQDRFIASAQIGITLASLGLGMYGEHAVAGWFMQAFTAMGQAGWVAASSVSTGLAVGILTYLHIVVGEMVPKSLALQRPEHTGYRIVGPMRVFGTVIAPAVLALNTLGNGLLRLVGVDRRRPSADRYYTPEELQVVVRESGAHGTIAPSAARVIDQLLEFGALTARDVMQPRVRIVGLPIGLAGDALRAVLSTDLHTRYPVFDGDPDHIVGSVHVKELFAVVRSGRAVALTDVTSMATVPETARLDQVLTAMRRERNAMALVVDEHGGTAGIVTLEDLFEEVVGDIDEGPSQGPAPEPAGRLLVPGTLRIDELAEQTGIDVSHPDVERVSGLILTLLGRVPVVGDTVTFRGVRFEVTAVQGRGIEEVAVAWDPGAPDAAPS